MMQGQLDSGPRPNNVAPETARQSTNSDTDANLIAQSLQLLSLQTAAYTPLPQSPGLASPQAPPDAQRLPYSPGFPSTSRQSVSRSSTPALERKTSNSSLQSDMPPTPSTPRAPAGPRRSSLNPNNMSSSPMSAKTPLASQAEEKAPLRACDVAEEYFRKELALHEGIVGAATAGTVVLIHDHCYGHRFSRPKTAKSALGMIVERPERIIASVMGISAAYVRLGGRHSEGTNPPHPAHMPSERIPFKIRKTSRLVDITSPVVTNVHGLTWMNELKQMCGDAGGKLATTGKELLRQPNPAPLPQKDEFHEGDLYLCAESLNAFQGALGGVLDAVDAVFQGTSTGTGPSRAFVCIRPPGHHCSDDHPSGFCWINNVHVGIEHAIMQYGLTHAAIIDFDLHHGDGSQSIAWARNKKVQSLPKNTSNRKKTSIGYFSLHDINSFPCEYGDDDKVQAASLCIDSAHGQTIWNVHLQPWKTIDEFWELYEDRYLLLLEKTRKYLKSHTHRLQTSPNHPAPKAAMFLSAGFDASEWETPGMQRHGTNVPTEFYARFTRDVVRLAEEEGTGVEGRIISVLEGGYSDRALTSGVLSHLSGLTDGQVSSDGPTSGGLAFDVRQGLGALSIQEDDMQVAPPQPQPTPVSYDPHWWSLTHLSELENLVNPPPMAIPKKIKSGPPPNFSSPTQSFTAKVVDPTKLTRTVSGKYFASPSRAPTPPPPEVDWATASHTLSKLLVPSDRQTLSCKPEELAQPKVKKEKPLPVLTSVHMDPSGRQLRGRKPVASYAVPGSDDEHTSTSASSKVNRRRTMAVLPQASEEPTASRPESRRMSIASSIGSVNGDLTNSRASSVMSGRRKSVTPASNVPTGGVQMKKARGAAPTASRIPKNQPPVPRVPSGYANKSADIKENVNDVDNLTTGLKRITLKLPTQEEYEAREKQKAQDAEKKAGPTTTGTKTATRKPVASRAKAPKSIATTAKKAPGRLSKVSKPTSPTETAAAKLPELDLALVPIEVALPQQPQIQSAVTPPLAQPQPVLPEQTAAILPKFGEAERVPVPLMGIVDPPTELKEMKYSPEQLPKPPFMTADNSSSPITASPPRPDTPPPPAPSMMPSLVSKLSAPSRDTMTQTMVKQEPRDSLHWVHPNMEASVSAAATRQDLPVFSSHGSIPFAPNPNAASSLVTSGTTENKVEDGSV